MYDRAVSGDLLGFNVALEALSDPSPAELSFLQRVSVIRIILTSFWLKPIIVNYPPMQGDSLLHALCAKGLANAVATLLRRGVHVNIVNKVSYWIFRPDLSLCFFSYYTVNSTDKE